MEEEPQLEAKLNDMLSLDEVVPVFTSDPVPEDEIINIEDSEEPKTVEEQVLTFSLLLNDLDLWAHFEEDADQHFAK